MCLCSSITPSKVPPKMAGEMATPTLKHIRHSTDSLGDPSPAKVP